jgi:hypothetical protein
MLTKDYIHDAVVKARAAAAKRNETTVDLIDKMHREAFEVAAREGQGSAMTQAAQNLAKLHGLIAERAQVSSDITIEVVQYQTDTKTIDIPPNQ